MTTLNLEIHFYQQDEAAIFLESNVIGDEEEFAEVLLFCLYTQKLMINLGRHPVCDSLSELLAQIPDDFSQITQLAAAKKVRLVDYRGSSGRKRFLASLHYADNRLNLNLKAKGFGILARGMGYYAPTSVILLFQYLVKRRQTTPFFVSWLTRAARQCANAYIRGKFGLGSSYGVSLMITMSSKDMSDSEDSAFDEWTPPPLPTPPRKKATTPTHIATAQVPPAPQPKPPVSTATATPPPHQVTEQINPKDGAVMVYIPEGEFLMGTSDAQIDALPGQLQGWIRPWFVDEKPQHSVYLDGYWIYKHEVTVAQYRKFCQENGRPMPIAPSWGWYDDHPIVNVTWHDAGAYSQWAGVALQTEAQWEKAARGTDGRMWPWGNEWDSRKCNSGESGIRKTTPVGSFPSGASPYGLMDMAGNVWEWCMNEYDAVFYIKSSLNNPVPGGIISLVNNNFTKVRNVCGVRGGSWGCDPVLSRAAYRAAAPPTGSDPNVGFRCAVRSNKIPDNRD